MFTHNPAHPDKYARLEEERRFLLQELPEDLAQAAGFVRIFDHYLPGTRLRLRRIETPQGKSLVYKFGQKYRAPGQQPHQAMMTNLYLQANEYRLLLQLGGLPLVKRRYDYHHGAVNYSLDVFEGVLSGLVLAEVEAHATEDLAGLPVPAFAVREVTADPMFEGGALAALTADQFQQRLAGWL